MSPGQLDQPRYRRIRVVVRVGMLCAFSFIVFACGDNSETLEQTAVVDMTVHPFDEFIPNQSRSTPVVTGAAWVKAPFRSELFEHAHDPDAMCPGLPYREEYGGVEISTERCDEITLMQPSLVDIERGDELRILAWHSVLVSEDPGAHVGNFMVAIGDRIVWSEQSEIPSQARSFDVTLQSQVSVEKGEPVRVHVHNHGANAWNLLAIEKIERP